MKPVCADELVMVMATMIIVVVIVIRSTSLMLPKQGYVQTTLCMYKSLPF